MNPAYDERLAAVEAEFNRLVRRLGSLSLRAIAQRRPALTQLVHELAQLDVEVESGPAGAIPDLPDHGLADAVAVIGADVVAALRRSPNQPALDRLAAVLRDGRG